MLVYNIALREVMLCAIIISVLICVWLTVRGLFLSLSDSVYIWGHEHDEARGGKRWHEMSLKVANEASIGLSGELDLSLIHI